jgi:pimeloyl-ACP methyl ester carboxylesterase
LSTQTFVGNKCFKWTMQSPGWFMGMLRIGNKIKMINRSIYKFVEYYIHDEEVRKELYVRWTSMRKCNPDLKQIRKYVEKSNTRVRLLYGAHDRIILSSPALRFIKGLQHAKIEILDCGHQVLHSKNVHEIVKALID